MGHAKQDGERTLKVSNSRNDALVVKLRSGEDAEYAIRKFMKKVRNSGLMQELMEREHYEKPSIKRRRKRAKARLNAKAVRVENDDDREFF